MFVGSSSIFQQFLHFLLNAKGGETQLADGTYWEQFECLI